MAKTSLKKDSDQSAPRKTRKRGRVRLIIGLILVALVVAFSLIVLINMRQRVEAASGAERELLRKGLQNDYIVCASLLIVALGIAFGLAPARRHIALCIIGCTVWGVALLVVGETAYLVGNTIVHASDRDDTSQAQYAVVIGDPLQNRQASNDLAARIDAAADWWKERNDKDVVIIASNASVIAVQNDFEEEAETVEAAVEVEHAGRVKNKGNTPSAVIRSTLDEKGVPKYAVKEEKASETVRGCFEQVLSQFSKIKKDTPIIIITNGSYINDAVRIAKDVGFTSVSRLPAASTFSGYLTGFLWETWLRYDPELKPSET